MIQVSILLAEATLVQVAQQVSIVGLFPKLLEMIMETRVHVQLAMFVKEVLPMRNHSFPYLQLLLEVLSFLPIMDQRTQDIQEMELQTLLVQLGTSNLQHFLPLVFLVERAITVQTQE